MNPHRPPPAPAPGRPGDGSSPAQPLSRRVQPPLTEVLQGLDARELEGETVFDQLFGPPAAAPAPRR